MRKSLLILGVIAANACASPQSLVLKPIANTTAMGRPVPVALPPAVDLPRKPKIDKSLGLLITRKQRQLEIGKDVHPGFYSLTFQIGEAFEKLSRDMFGQVFRDVKLIRSRRMAADFDLVAEPSIKIELWVAQGLGGGRVETRIGLKTKLTDAAGRVFWTHEEFSERYKPPSWGMSGTIASMSVKSSNALASVVPDAMADAAGKLGQAMQNLPARIFEGSGVLPGSVAARIAPASRTTGVKRPVVRSDIDTLPGVKGQIRRAHAIVIGIEQYREKLPIADYAVADAKLMARYLKRVLGVPKDNVALLTGNRASKGDFEKYFERWLPNRVEEGDEVFVYFSGHGAPNPARGDAYLVPYDGDPTYLEQTGYPLKRLYAQLGKLPARQITVVIDSCFSGAGGRSVIARGARPLVTVQTEIDLPANITVFSASASNQISHSYDKTGHGLFTYFLLKGIKEGAKDFSAAFIYAGPKVERIARREYNSDQVPQRRKGR